MKVCAMRDYPEDVSREVAAVFVDGYERELAFLSNNREKLIAAFQKMIRPDVFYVAALDGEIVGILACSHNQCRALAFDQAILRQSFGYVKGSIAYYLMKNEFLAPLPYYDDTGYIECVATKVKARGRGISTALMRYVLATGHYNRYVLEVTDANEVAQHIYRKFGFTEFNRKKERFAKLKGFEYRIYMELFAHQAIH